MPTSSLIFGKFRLVNNVKRGVGLAYKKWKSLSDSRQPKRLKELAEKLVQESGLSATKLSDLDDLAVFQKNCFPEFKIKVVSLSHGSSVITQHPRDECDPMQTISLLLDCGHFDLITTLPGFHGSSCYSNYCDKPFHTTEKHR